MKTNNYIYNFDDILKLEQLLEEEKKFVKNLSQNNLVENKSIINTQDYFFYPIIIDTEINVKGKWFLIGLFFVNSNKHICLLLQKDSSVEYIEKFQKELSNLFYFFEMHNLEKYNKDDSEKLYPILVGHNILKYDFILLNKILNYYNSIRNILDILINYNTLIIEYDIKHYTRELREDRNSVYKYGDKFLFLDTLGC